MDDSLVRRGAGRPRRVSVAAELGANVSLHSGTGIELQPVAREALSAGDRLGAAAGRAEMGVEVYQAREAHPGTDRPSAAAVRTERRNSAPQVVYQRHMPIEPLKFPIPRKTKEQKALFQYVSTESREFEDMMTVLTSSYVDSSSSGCFTYSKPRLVHSEPLEREFVEKRREMKAEGRTEKELEESYCFLLTDSVKLQLLCERGLLTGQSWITALGNPGKGVYLSRYSDLLQINPFSPGTTGEIIIFKVMKGKVKSIYENMKNLLDPTPRFDSHISKNASKVTSVTSYRALELTQQYFYEYSFDELRQRPRQVCPYAVVSFQVKGKDSPLPTKALAPLRLNSQSAEGSKERAQFTVWSGDLVRGDQVLFQICLRSFSPPFLPRRLSEKLEVGCVMKLDELTRMLPADLLSYDLYRSGQEVVKDGHCCSLLEVIDRNRSTVSVTKLLQELEINRVVLVTPLTDRGFLFLLSSVQMAAPTERGENWRRSLQALFVFPESRDMTTSSLPCSSSSHDTSELVMSVATVMPRVNQFIPALHHALVKARANPPPELSAGVERQAREYLVGLSDGKVRQYPMGEYDSRLDEEGKPPPAPKHHRVNMDGYLQSYLFSPALYLLSVARARQLVEAHCDSELPPPAEGRNRKMSGGQRDAQTNSQKIQQLIDLLLTCKRNAENEVRREDGAEGPGKKRKLEQEAAERALKFLRASQGPGQATKIPVEGGHVPPSSVSLTSVLGSVGLRDVDLSEDGSELAARLVSLMTDLNQAAGGAANQSLCEVQEEGPKESCPFDRLATKLGLPTSCDIDLRRQDELEEQTAGSVSSLEGFSPSSHSGELNHRGGGGGGGGGRLGRRAGVYEEEEEEEEEEEIPWVLIPITGVCSDRYTHRDRNLPQDPRFQYITAATSITKTTARPPSPAPSPCASPDPSPPPSPSQCPSPEPSPPLSTSPCLSPQTGPPPSFFRGRSPGLDELRRPNEDRSGTNKEPLTSTASGEFTGDEEPQGRIQKNREPSVRGSAHQFEPAATEGGALPLSRPSPHPSPSTHTEQVMEEVGEEHRQPAENEEGDGCGQEEMMSDSEQQQEVEEEELGVSPPSTSSAPPRRDIDSIVNRHLCDFSSELQLLLQEESVHCSLPPSHTHASRHTDTPPFTAVSPFSQYVSFYNPCPPVHDYISSLRDSIGSLLTELTEHSPRHPPDSSCTHADTALANRVSAFVASVRAANTATGGDEDEDDDDDRNPASSGLVLGADRSPGTSTKAEPSRPREPVSSTSCGSAPGPGSGPAPPGSALSSLISRLQPEVFSNLVEIFKDVKRNSVQFYLHSCTPGDQVHLELKEYLLQQGNVEQDPLDFVQQQQSDSRLLVIIRNKDIAAHVHQIPGLVSLKRLSSVVFVGIDTLDDIRNHGFNELFVSGGCIVSDELLFGLDAISHDRLAALLRLLEQHTSQDSVWRWKVHFKTQKKLKEQARFRRDAATLLDLLSAYQKKQIVEFLPYHHCDAMNHQSPDLDCLIELQARYTRYRHTIFLTEHHSERSPACSTGGIIVSGIEEILRNFTSLVGCSDVRDRQPFIDDLLAPKGDSRRLIGGDSVLGSDCSLNSSEGQTQELLSRPSSSVPHVSDQLVPDASFRDVLLQPSDTDCEVLRMAVSQLRAQRQAQRQAQQLESELNVNLLKNVLPGPVSPGGVLSGPAPGPVIPGGVLSGPPPGPVSPGRGVSSPPPGLGTPTDSVQLTPGRKAVAATLEFIHSSLHPEEDQEGPLPGGQRRGGGPGGGLGGLLGQTWAPSNSDSCINLSNPNAAMGTAVGDLTDFASDGRVKLACGGAAHPVDAGRSRDVQERPIRTEGASPGNTTASGTKVTGSVALTTDQEDITHPPVPRPHQHYQQQHLQRGVGVLQPHHLPPTQSQPFPQAPMLGPLTPLGGVRSLLGSPPVWPSSLGPPGPAALVWDFQHGGRDLSRLLGGYNGPAAQGGRYGGGPRGGGFNRT